MGLLSKLFGTLYDTRDDWVPVSQTVIRRHRLGDPFMTPLAPDRVVSVQYDRPEKPLPWWRR